MFALQAFGVILCAYLLVRVAGLTPVLATAASLAVLLGLYLVVTLVTFAICWPRRSTAVPDGTIGFFAMCRTMIEEWLALFALFAIIQPFADSLFSVKGSAKGRSEKLPVLLVHGYSCNSALWWWMIARIRNAAYTARAIDLVKPNGIDSFSDQLHGHVEAFLKETGAEKLKLVTHSMGGLVAMTYLRRHGAARVDKLIALACPFHGTRLAYLGRGRHAREMEPPSSFLTTVLEPAPVSTVTIWSAQDDFVFPQTSAHLKGAKEIELTGIGHLAFVFSPRVLALVLKELGLPGESDQSGAVPYLFGPACDGISAVTSTKMPPT